MTGWTAVVGACLLCLGLKLVGYVVPADVLDRPGVVRVAGLVTVGLLASLVATQTFSDGQAVTVDARLAALGVAVVALLLRAPFLLVVLLGAGSAAGLRALGWAS